MSYDQTVVLVGKKHYTLLDKELGLVEVDTCYDCGATLTGTIVTIPRGPQAGTRSVYRHSHTEVQCLRKRVERLEAIVTKITPLGFSQ